jgi:uncharacterized protein YgiB involved in biofilm formation
MKRARTLKLVLMGATLSGCSDTATIDQDVRLFTNVEQCTTSGGMSSEMTAADCRKSFDEAKENYPKDAPKFPSKDTCEKAFGINGCTSSESSGQSSSISTSWMPFFAGMMVGSLMNNGQHHFVAQPIYGTAGTRRCNDGRLIPEQYSCDGPYTGSGAHGGGSYYRTSGDPTPIHSDALGRATLSNDQAEGMKTAAIRQHPSLNGKVAISRGGFGAHAGRGGG